MNIKLIGRIIGLIIITPILIPTLLLFQIGLIVVDVIALPFWIVICLIIMENPIEAFKCALWVLSIPYKFAKMVYVREN